MSSRHIQHLSSIPGWKFREWGRSARLRAQRQSTPRRRGNLLNGGIFKIRNIGRVCVGNSLSRDLSRAISRDPARPWRACPGRTCRSRPRPRSGMARRCRQGKWRRRRREQRGRGRPVPEGAGRRTADSAESSFLPSRLPLNQLLLSSGPGACTHSLGAAAPNQSRDSEHAVSPCSDWRGMHTIHSEPQRTAADSAPTRNKHAAVRRHAFPRAEWPRWKSSGWPTTMRRGRGMGPRGPIRAVRRSAASPVANLAIPRRGGGRLPGTRPTDTVTGPPP